MTAQNLIIYDLIWNKVPLLARCLWPDLWKETTVKTSQKQFVYIQCVRMHSNPNGNVWSVQLYVYKLFLRCFNSGSFSQIWSQMFCQKCYLITNQVTCVHWSCKHLCFTVTFTFKTLSNSLSCYLLFGKTYSIFYKTELLNKTMLYCVTGESKQIEV